MNTTPKQQDGDGGTEPAEGHRSPLEQTVLGVAPRPSGVLPAFASAPSPPPLLPAGPSVAGGGPSIVAAPIIALADSSPAAPVAHDAAGGDAANPAAADAGAARERPEAPAGVAATLQLSRSPLPASTVPRPEPRAARPPIPPALPDPASPQQTALSADYLRAARDAALEQLSASQPEPPSRPSEESAEASASPRPPVPSPAAFESVLAGPIATQAGSPRDEWEEHPPRSVGTRPSIAPPLLDSPAVFAARPSATSARGFEPVPVLRAPLAESLSASFGPIAELGSHRHPPTTLSMRTPSPLPRSRESGGRWMLLCSMALATVGVIALGVRLWDRYRGSAGDIRTVTAPANDEGTTSPSTPARGAPGPKVGP